MARTASNMMALGTVAPNFTLPDVVSGNKVSLQSGHIATLIMFICNHCPFVKHIQQQLVTLGQDYVPKGVNVIAINANDVENYPDDAPDKMKVVAEELGYNFPYLYDETQETAKAYQAACTPDFYIFDQELRCVYRGQLDDSRPGSELPVTGQDIRAALDALLAGKSVNEIQKPSLGCNIKWKGCMTV